jgi:hypothetical protein
MKYLKFIGTYTGGRETITYLGCTFTGHEPREVPAEVAEYLADNPEFAVVDPLDHDGDGRKGGSRPRKKAG